MEHGKLVAAVTVVGEGDAPKYVQKIHAGKHELLADEHAALGGADAGPNPFAYLLSGLGACTSITLRMYAERKGWALGAIVVDLELRADGAPAGRRGRAPPGRPAPCRCRSRRGAAR